MTDLFRKEMLLLLDQYDVTKNMALYAQKELRDFKSSTHFNETLN